MYEGPVQDLIDELGRLPGIGPKSAQRIAFHLLGGEPEDLLRLKKALGAVESGVKFCRICGNIAAAEVCNHCQDPQRDGGVVCVVEEPKDVQAIDATGEFGGRFHVLGGVLDPLAGIGPDHLRITQLVARISGALPDVDDTTAAPEITELIIATDPTTKGEATASYLVRLLKDVPGLQISRLASGLPMGTNLELVDEVTLGRALSERRILHQSVTPTLP